MPVIDEYLKEVLSKKGSDLHFIAGDPPRIRLYGDLQPLRPERLDKEFVQNTLYEIMPKTAVHRFEEHDGATTVRFTHSDLWDEEAVRSHEDGWTKAFDNLERALAGSG